MTTQRANKPGNTLIVLLALLEEARGTAEKLPADEYGALRQSVMADLGPIIRRVEQRMSPAEHGIHKFKSPLKRER